MAINKQSHLKKIISYFVVGVLFILPYQQHIFNISTEFFPALDIVIIFIITIHYRLKYWQLFIIGCFLDFLNTTQEGLHALILIIAELLIRYISSKISYLSYFFKLLLFLSYIFSIAMVKYIIISIIDNNNFPIEILIMHYFITILTYPIIYLSLETFLNLEEKGYE